MIVVLDSNAVIGLSKGAVFELLPRFCSQVLVAPAVYEEVVTNGQGRAGAGELRAAAGDWVSVTDPSLQSRAEFGAVQNRRDREILALAYETRPHFLVTGDEEMCQFAAERGLPVMSLLELLLAAKQIGVLPALRPVVDAMLSQEFSFPHGDLERALHQAGEVAP